MVEGSFWNFVLDYTISRETTLGDAISMSPKDFGDYRFWERTGFEDPLLGRLESLVRIDPARAYHIADINGISDGFSFPEVSRDVLVRSVFSRICTSRYQFLFDLFGFEPITDEDREEFVEGLTYRVGGDNLDPGDFGKYVISCNFLSGEMLAQIIRKGNIGDDAEVSFYAWRDEGDFYFEVPENHCRVGGGAYLRTDSTLYLDNHNDCKQKVPKTLLGRFDWGVKYVLYPPLAEEVVLKNYLLKKLFCLPEDEPPF